MTKIEKTGSSVESVIAAFRREHNIKDWELKYDIIKKPSSGLFGLFAQKTAVLRFELPEIQDRVRLFLQMLLSKMGVAYDKVISNKEGKSVYVEVKGCKDPGFFIGKNGSMLETVQFFLNRVFEGDRSLESVYLDAEGYRERRDSQFLRPFLPLIAKVRGSGKALTLDPMPASDRRVIHRHIEGQNGLRTLTIGEGEKKRIVIFSSRQSEKEALSQATGKAPAPKQQAAPAPEAKSTPRPRRRPKPAADQEKQPKPTPSEPAAATERSSSPGQRRRYPRRPAAPKRTEGE